MKILVTGANGFLGHWLIKRLLSEGNEISVLLRNPNDFNFFKQKGIQVFHGDVTNEDSLVDAIKGQTQIYHLAGLVAYDRKQFQIMNLINATGTENIFKIAALNNVQRVLTVSSVVSIGATFKPEILDEEFTYNLSRFKFGYHESKRNAETIVCKYVKENKVDGVIVNPSTIYGPGDASKASRSTQLKVAQGKIFFYPSGGVSVAYVEDDVDGMIKALQRYLWLEKCRELTKDKEIYFVSNVPFIHSVSIQPVQLFFLSRLTPCCKWCISQ